MHVPCTVVKAHIMSYLAISLTETDARFCQVELRVHVEVNSRRVSSLFLYHSNGISIALLGIRPRIVEGGRGK